MKSLTATAGGIHIKYRELGSSTWLDHAEWMAGTAMGPVSTGHDDDTYQSNWTLPYNFTVDFDGLNQWTSPPGSDSVATPPPAPGHRVVKIPDTIGKASDAANSAHANVRTYTKDWAMARGVDDDNGTGIGEAALPDYDDYGY